MTAEVEILKVVISFVAGLATLTSCIYTWVMFKTKPLTYTIFGITVLLWMVALSLWNQRYIMWYVSDATSNYVANIRSLFLGLVAVGYILFLLGTYRSGPICKKVNNNNAKKGQS